MRDDIKGILNHKGCVKGKWVAECQPEENECIECTIDCIMQIIDNDRKRLTDALRDMCYQFAYDGNKDGKSMISAGGLSPLENAFEALGWDDPHFVIEIPFNEIRNK